MSTSAEAAKQRMDGVGFGSFSDDEVDQLYTNQANKKPVEFICSKRPVSFTPGIAGHTQSRSSNLPACSPVFHFSSPVLSDHIQFGSSPLFNVSPTTSTPPPLTPSTNAMPTPSSPSTSLSPSTKPPSKLNVHAKEFVPQFQNLSIIRKVDWQQQQEATRAPPPAPSSLPLSQSPVLVASSSSSPAPSSPQPSANPSSSWPQTEGQSSSPVAASPLSDALTPITTTQDTNDPPVSCSSGYVSERGDDYQKTYSPTQQEGRDAGSPVSERDLVESPTLSREPADASSLSGESGGFIAPSSECEESEETHSNQVTSKDSSRQSHEASSTRRSSVTHETVSCPSLPTRSWAAIVGKQTTSSSSSSSVSLTAISSGTRETTPPPSVRPVATSQKSEGKHNELNSDIPTTTSSRLKQLGEQLASASVSHQPVSLTPRGLINTGHLCYVHAPLQALISCPSFYNLLHSLKTADSTVSSSTVVTDSLIHFTNEFYPYCGKDGSSTDQESRAVGRRKRGGKGELLYGDPFKPLGVYEMLTKIKCGLSVKGRQEDAEEFLGCILNHLHDELIAARQAVSPSSEENDKSREEDEEKRSEEAKDDDEEEEWQEVGPRNRSTITRRMAYSESLVSEIFGGKLQSSVTRQHKKESVTVEPFFSLQLDVQGDKVWNVSDALELLTQKQQVNFTADKDEETGYQRMALVHLPPVLVLHLKRFLFNSTGSQKINKHVAYDMHLEISKDLLSQSVRGKFTHQQKKYQLWAVVYHHGRTAQGGHYTCDVYHPPSRGWIRIDDSFVKPITEEAVLNPNMTQPQTKVAYLLFYRRMDTIFEHRKNF